MDALAKHGTTLIVLINTLFGIIGLVFLVGGVMVKMGSSLIDSVASHVLAGLADKIPAQAANIDVTDMKISDFVGGAADVFIGVGCGLLFLVFWAYCGTCCKSKWMLIVYAFLLSAIILGEIAVVVIYTNDRNLIEDKIKDPMKQSLEDYYTGMDGHDGLSKGWTTLMSLLGCCGVDGPSDFKDAKQWNHTDINAPDVCCNDITECEGHTEPRNYNSGCYVKLWSLIENNKGVVIGVGSGIGAFQLLLLFLVIWIIRQTKSNKVGPKK